MTFEGELERCRPWIEAAMEYSGGTHEFEDIVQALIDGRMQFWPAAWGRGQGCSGMTMAGRLGWERVFTKLEWKRSMVVMERGI
jgi:hypothetical protein